MFSLKNSLHKNKHGHSHNIPDFTQFNPVFIFQAGIVKRLDGLIIVQGFYNHQNGQHDTNIGDTTLKFDIGILEEKPYHPAISLGIKEIFPTGKYENLSSHKGGVDATGAGSYQTGVNLNISKVVWWISTHPMDFRLSLNYVFPAPVSVSGFNNYGGGFGTNGKIHPGQNFTIDFGYEFSFNPHWVIALDTAYTYAFKTTFSGTSAGVLDSLGTPATNGSPFNDQLSLAPAIEYNFNPNLGVIGGVWFSVWGRNSLNFVSGVLSVTYTF
ncbi:MAG: hypothetical protein HZB76_00950 [Chlamydiae bacterium]|nr:hypothetical protein [Chlamydiota bacterium]